MYVLYYQKNECFRVELSLNCIIYIIIISIINWIYFIKFLSFWRAHLFISNLFRRDPCPLVPRKVVMVRSRFKGFAFPSFLHEPFIANSITPRYRLFFISEIYLEAGQGIPRWGPAHQRIFPAAVVLKVDRPSIFVIGSTLHHVFGKLVDAGSSFL